MQEPFRKFRLILTVLLTFEVLLGAAIIAVTAIYRHYLGTFLTQRQSRILSSTFVNSYTLGFQLIVTYMCSISMWKRVWLRRYSLSIRLLMSVWLFFCILIVVCGCVIVWSLLTGVEVLSEIVGMMMFRGIDVYYINPEWKFLWDQLQYRRECCGVNGYEDWMHATWMPVVVATPAVPAMYRYGDYESEFDEEYPKRKMITNCIGREHHAQTSVKAPSSYESQPPITTDSPTSNGDSEPGLNEGVEGEHTLAPYACCRHDSLSCYQNYIPKPDGGESMSQLNLTEISTRGCLPLFKEYLCCATNILLILILAAIVIDIFICCLTKYLMFKNGINSYRELENDVSFVDDDGNALVVVKCPPKVKCITLEESTAYDSDIPNVCSDTEPCTCCCDNERSYDSPAARAIGPLKRTDVLVH